jgi:hypothetical protein
MYNQPTSRFDPYNMAWVMIDLISVARPVLVHVFRTYIHDRKIGALLWVKFCDLVHIDVHLHHSRSGKDE